MNNKRAAIFIVIAFLLGATVGGEAGRRIQARASLQGMAALDTVMINRNIAALRELDQGRADLATLIVEGTLRVLAKAGEDYLPYVDDAATQSELKQSLDAARSALAGERRK